MLRYTVDVTPNASTNEVLKHNNEVLRVRVTAPAREGKANKAVIGTLAKYFGVPKSKILIISGVNRKRKMIGVIND